MQLTKQCVFQIPGGDWYVETRTGFEGPFSKYSEAAEYHASYYAGEDQPHLLELARVNYSDSDRRTKL